MKENLELKKDKENHKIILHLNQEKMLWEKPLLNQKIKHLTTPKNTQETNKNKKVSQVNHTQKIDNQETDWVVNKKETEPEKEPGEIIKMI